MLWMLLIFIALFLAEHCVISPAGQLWLLREVHKQAWHSESPAQGETTLGGAGGLERERTTTETSEQIQPTYIYIIYKE